MLSNDKRTASLESQSASQEGPLATGSRVERATTPQAPPLVDPFVRQGSEMGSVASEGEQFVSSYIIIKCFHEGGLLCRQL